MKEEPPAFYAGECQILLLEKGGQMQIDEGRQQQIRNYTRARKRVSFVFLIPLGIVAGLFIGSTGSIDPFENTTLWLYMHVPLFQWQPVQGWYPLQVLAYYLIFMVGFLLLSFPFFLYTEHLKRRYHIPRQPLRLALAILGWARLLFVARWALLMEALYLFFAFQPATWWLWTALAFSIMLAIRECIGRPGWFRPFTVRPLPENEQTNRIHAWLAQHSDRTYHLFEVDLPGGIMQANAWAFGWGSNRRIYFSSTLLKTFPPEEIDVIVAHELGHHLQHDTWKRLFYRSIISFASFFALQVVALQWEQFHIYEFGTNMAVTTGTVFQDPAVAKLFFNDAMINPFTLLVLLIYLSAFLLLGNIFYNRYRRRREYQADEFALQTTRNAAAFKSAFIRLDHTNWISINPGGTNNSTHPFTASRLKHADDFEKAQMQEQ
jgi:STE24 endopeptidase